MSKELPEIDSVRVYQAVMFEKGSQTFFSTRKINSKNAVEIVVNRDLNGVEIKSDKDHILVPLTNVSCIYFKSPIKVQQEENSKTELEKKKELAKANSKDKNKRPV